MLLFGSGKRLDRLRRLRLADSPLRNRHASRAVPPSRFRLKTCRRHIFHTPKPSQVRILLNGNKKEASTGWHLLLFGSGKRIRTSTYGVRVRCATITQYRYVQFQIASGIIQCSKGKVKLFFACLKSFRRFSQSRNSDISESGLRTFSRSLSSSAA